MVGSFELTSDYGIAAWCASASTTQTRIKRDPGAPARNTPILSGPVVVPLKAKAKGLGAGGLRVLEPKTPDENGPSTVPLLFAFCSPKLEGVPNRLWFSQTPI